VFAAEASLRECGTGQSTVATALEGNGDMHLAAQTVRSVEGSCREAANDIRRDPPPGPQWTETASAADGMADGLEDVASALDMYDRSPNGARRLAQRGMQKYQAALAKLDAANR